jgi:hypothetical protein
VSSPARNRSIVAHRQRETRERAAEKPSTSRLRAGRSHLDHRIEGVSTQLDGQAGWVSNADRRLGGEDADAERR